MYPHRLVVDANCINAKGRLSAMTELEQYHIAGAVELIVTSTLPVELDAGSIQATKAGLYQRIGAYPLHMPNHPAAQSAYGVTVRPSLLTLLHTELFGPLLQNRSINDMRDCLHLDQAQMNAADMFVTNDKRLYAAEGVLASQGVRLAVLSPERALAYVQGYLRSTIGTDQITHTKAHMEELGPLVIGSSWLSACDLVNEKTLERLAAFKIQDGLLHVQAKIRDDSGNVQVRLSPGEQPEVFSRGTRVTMSGRGPILAGEEPANIVVVSSDSQVFLAIRTTHDHRVIVYGLELCDERGTVVASVRWGHLALQGAALVQ